jgi:hypothetical protein
MKTVTLKYPVFASGEGLPKGGVCVANAGEEVKVETVAGQTYVLIAYKGLQLRIATILT